MSFQFFNSELSDLDPGIIANTQEISLFWQFFFIFGFVFYLFYENVPYVYVCITGYQTFPQPQDLELKMAVSHHESAGY